MLNELLASAGWILDLVFFLVLILGTVLGAYKGFIAGVLKLAGKLFSVIFAIMFCVSFANFLELCFHMTTGIANGIASSLLDNEGYAIGLLTDVKGAEIGEALKDIGIGVFPRWIIALSFSGVETIPAGTNAAMLLGSVLSKWISIVISFLLLIILIRFGVRFLAKGLHAITNKIAPLRVVDQFLGAVLGLFKAAFLIFFLLLLCNWLPIPALHEFLGSSAVVGSIFSSEWFQSATSYAVSGAWFHKFIGKAG